MRYLPLVRQAKALGYEDRITEVGSGDLGITPYLRRRVVGVDQGFTQPNPLMEQIEGSVLSLPFEDRSRPYVLSTDMLEHIPPDVRQPAIDEMVRVARDYLVMATPTGKPAEDQDRELDAAFLRLRGERFPFLVEHVDNGLPRPEQIDDAIRTALAKHGREGTVTYSWNTNLTLRSGLMRLWMRGGLVGSSASRLLCLTAPLLSRAHFGTCYRLVATVRFGQYLTTSNPVPAVSATDNWPRVPSVPPRGALTETGQIT